MTQTLRIEELRRVCTLLLDAAQDRFGGEINLSDHDVDYYWNVDLRAAFAMGREPTADIDVGQSSDDLAELNGLLRRDPDEIPALWHDLQHLAGIFRLLAYLDLPDTGADGN